MNEALEALYFAALYTADRATELNTEASTLQGIAEKTGKALFQRGIREPEITAMKGRVQKIRILHNDIGNALTEIDTQVENL